MKGLRKFQIAWHDGAMVCAEVIGCSPFWKIDDNGNLVKVEVDQCLKN